MKPLHDRAGWRNRPFGLLSQVWFFNAVGVPLFQALAEVLPAARCQLEAVRENCAYWEGRLEAEKVKKVSTTNGGEIGSNWPPAVLSRLRQRSCHHLIT